MARSDSQSRAALNSAQRAEVFDKTVDTVAKQYFDPGFNGLDWPSVAQSARERAIGTIDPDAFELAMHELVHKLGTSHTGFFHQSLRRLPARLAIGANFQKTETETSPAWVTVEIHAGGPADKAGLRRSDILVALDGKLVVPPEPLTFPMNIDLPVTVQRGPERLELSLSIPPPSSRKQPYADMEAVTFKQLPGNVGYLKVAIFPGLLGLDVARQIDHAVSELQTCERLVLDLRGHVGGGLGVLRLMSHLTPDKLPIGYTVTRKRAERGYNKEALKKLERLPTELPNPLAIASIALQFAGRDLSILLVSEGLGSKRWHGQVAILVNENTISAGEMVAAFAAENGLARLVGTETAGRLIPSSRMKVGHGYTLVIPKAEYVTWKGNRFEGQGIEPNLKVQWQPHSSKDDQLEAALASFSD